MKAKLACILAAGMGTRLGKRGRQCPKGFLELGTRPIIEESMEKLRSVGIERIVIVTGHLAHYYEKLATESPHQITLVHNPRFDYTGSLASLYEARSVLKEPYLLLESDLIFEKRAVEICQEDPSADLVLVSGPTGAGDEVYVETRGSNLVSMSKKREQLGSVLGEFVGISKVSRDLHRELMTLADQRLTEEPHLCYETDGLVGCAAGHPIPCRLIPDLQWAEIDTEQHLHRALSTVYPRL